MAEHSDDDDDDDVYTESLALKPFIIYFGHHTSHAKVRIITIFVVKRSMYISLVQIPEFCTSIVGTQNALFKF